MICFYCKQPITTVNEGFLGDVQCPCCKVLNSAYDPKEREPEEPEDKPNATGSSESPEN